MNGATVQRSRIRSNRRPRSGSGSWVPDSGDPEILRRGARSSAAHSEIEQHAGVVAVRRFPLGGIPQTMAVDRDLRAEVSRKGGECPGAIRIR